MNDPTPPNQGEKIKKEKLLEILEYFCGYNSTNKESAVNELYQELEKLFKEQL